MELFGFFILFGMKIIAAGTNLTGAVGESEGLEFINPLFIYKHNKVNWFGALVIALFLFYVMSYCDSFLLVL